VGGAAVSAGGSSVLVAGESLSSDENELVEDSSAFVVANVPADGSSSPVEANVPGSSALGVGGATAPNGAVS
jgi:hypothetical protein